MLSLTVIPTHVGPPHNLCNCKDLGMGKRVGHGYICSHYNLKALFPSIAKDWDFSKNKSNPEDYAPASNKKVWWKCSTDPCRCHVWEASISSRTGKTSGCPYCCGQKVCPHDNLLVRYPTLCEEWDYEKNKLGPENYTCTSGVKVWWKCRANPCGCHKWESRIADRTYGMKGCSFCCQNKRPCPHYNFKLKFPLIAAEWDYSKNISLPEEYAPFANVEVWWKCSRDPFHIWHSTINHRTCMGSGCPVCNESKRGKMDQISSRFPQY